MTAFQKMMSSSPRAIRQALRRRLLVLLVREQIILEKKRRTDFGSELPVRILRLTDEMRLLARDIVATSPSAIASPAQVDAEADTYIAQVKQRVVKKLVSEMDETTEWSLDSDEEGDEGVFADAEIPDEAALVRELVALVPEGTDKKFDRLLAIVAHLRSMNENERFIIFTQYRETLEFLRIELAKIFGESKIATIKGGPLEDKIEAAERFWDENGAKFLISTSAGGEGINLQCARVLFNYDLPWNPMAVEQRIGRIHRYGQKEVSQVYSLVAQDTVEERIYRLLDNKLLTVAQTIGKTDPQTGEPLEDFRLEILGYLGSNPNYQQLFKQALVDRDYTRTAHQLEEMMQQAQDARSALMELSQDLTHFNLEHYRRITGRFHLKQLGIWCREAIIRLGGSILPVGEFWQVQTPECLKVYSLVAARYENVTFDRQLATRTKRCELFGIGHPLIDALLSYLQNAPFRGDAARVPAAGVEPGRIEARYRVTWDRAERGATSSVVLVELNGNAMVNESSWDTERWEQAGLVSPTSYSFPQDMETLAEEAIRLWIASRKTEMPTGTIPRYELLGVSVAN
jgi:hypothetical protein